MKQFYQQTGAGAFLLLFFIFNSFSFTAKADLFPFSATYSGANEIPANLSAGTGTIVGVYNDVTNRIFYTITFSGLSANTTAAHFHAPAAPGVNAAVTLAHTGFPAGVTSGTFSKSDVLSDLQETYLMTGVIYSNIHTAALPGGEIRAQIILSPASALVYSFNRTYSGANEVPANGSAGTGTIVGAYNSITNTIFYTITFSGLSANTSAAHFHAPAAPGVNAGVTLGHAGFPTGVTSGTLSRSDVFTDAQETNLLAGLMYSNIHTTALPGGEIRTQIFMDAPFVAPVLTCPANIVASNDPGVCTRSVSFAAAVTGFPAPVVTYKIGSTVITSPYTFPLGTTTVTVSAINGGGFSTCSFTVTINDTEAPVISNVSTSLATLWPANHKMKDVTVSYSSTDNCPGSITCVLSVSSNEPVNDLGDGNTSPDWMVVNNQLVKLRAERSGNGSGRIYTITISCTDQHGNTGTATTTVTVPHDMSAKARINGTAEADAEAGNLSVGVINNPSRNYFTLNIKPSVRVELVTVRLYDMSGRLVDAANNISTAQQVRIGSTLKAGIYLAEIRQGNEVRQLKLVKLD